MIPTWLIALLGGGGAILLALGARLGAWWRGRSAAKEKARLESEITRTVLERDVAAGEASVAKVEAGVLADHVGDQAAAGVVAREVRDAATGPTASDRIAGVDDWVRKNADSPGPVSNQSGTAPVRKR